MENTVDFDQTPHYAASDLGLDCLPITLLRVSRLEWVNSSRHMPNNSDKIRCASSNGQPACASVV